MIMNQLPLSIVPKYFTIISHSYSNNEKAFWCVFQDSLVLCRAYIWNVESKRIKTPAFLFALPSLVSIDECTV